MAISSISSASSGLSFSTSKRQKHLQICSFWIWNFKHQKWSQLLWKKPAVFATFLVFSDVFDIFVVWLHDCKIHPVSIPSFSETYAFHLLLGHLKQRYCYALRWRNLEGMTPSVLEEFRKQNSQRLPLNCQTGMQIVVHKLYKIILYPQ